MTLAGTERGALVAARDFLPCPKNYLEFRRTNC